MQNSFLNRSYSLFIKHNLANKLAFVLVIMAFFLCYKTIIGFVDESSNSDPTYMITLILLDLIVFLLLFMLATRKFLHSIFKDYKNARIRARIIMMFSIIAVIPTIIVSVFSVFVFNFGLQSWFDSKVSTAINQSVRVADLYISENKNQLRDAAFLIAQDLNAQYFDVIDNQEYLNYVLNALVKLRSLSEALVFQKNTNVTMAQTAMSFSLSFWSIPQRYYDHANVGEIVDISPNNGKIRMLIKLTRYHDTYLLVGKLVDEEIINYIDKTTGAASQYEATQKKMKSIQIKFALMFVFITSLLLTATVTIGSIFANMIARPIRRLVRATELVQAGDFTVQIPVNDSNGDELVILTTAFNRMVKKIDIQQKDLALAQRAMAWADVARRVAHEIKNPLTPILLSADRIVKKYSDDISDKEGFKKYISTIKRHTNDIEKIVTEFADFAKMPSPSFELYEIVSILRDLEESRQIVNDKINYHFSSNISELQFMCDTTQINQVMINLFKNAEEALENSLAEKHIYLSIELTEHDLEISVIDSGSGFAQNLIDKATEAYMTTRSKGSGLGLAIVKKIVQDHGGEILISNLPNKGGGVVKLIFSRKHISSKIKK